MASQLTRATLITRAVEPQRGLPAALVARRVHAGLGKFLAPVLFREVVVFYSVY
jgi:hypothetical protein